LMVYHISFVHFMVYLPRTTCAALRVEFFGTKPSLRAVVLLGTYKFFSVSWTRNEIFGLGSPLGVHPRPMSVK
jgi:hypothetical protein